MSIDPAELSDLREALAVAPGNRTLRRHVAGVLLDAAEDDGDAVLADEAGSHLRLLLAQQPDDVRLLRLAARAARLTGEPEVADAYEALIEAHGGEASERPAPPPPSPEEPAAGPAVRWSADGSHDDLEGEDPLWVRVEEADDGQIDLAEVEVPSITLDDVGGLDEVKRTIRTTFLAPMQNPELRELYGTSLRGGLLLWGPPGCGKTYLARALAGELGTQFLAIGLHEVLDMWLGQSERNVHELFETARRNAPCVLFLDEVDALGQKRSNLRHSAGRNVVAQLLAELDGLGSNNEGVYVVGATNQPWDLDPALRRPGRFDQTVLVLPPDPPARLAILRHHLEGRPLGEGLALPELAKGTDGYSGADLRYLCERAAQRALEASIESGTPRPIERADLEEARRQVAPSTGPWLESARTYAQFSNDGGRYDDLLAYLRTRRML